MGYILTIYSKNAYKEHLLPAITNANHRITLHRELFRLPEDVTLELENVNGQWLFLENKKFTMVYTDTRETAFEKNLQNNDICSLNLPSGEQITILVTVTDRFFHVFEKFSLDGVDRVSIGAGGENTVQYDFLHIVSKVHAVIMKKSGGYLVEDQSANGLFVNSRRVTGSKRLEYGDTINVFGLSIVFMDSFLAIDTAREGTQLKPGALQPYQPDGRAAASGEDSSHIFHRAPRYLPKLAADTVEIEAPPAPKETDQEPPLLAIGPAITMALPMLLGCSLTIFSAGNGGGVFLYTGLVTAVSSAVIGTVWALVNLRHAKKKLRESELKRFEVYGEYLISCANQVKEKYDQNSNILRQLYTDAAECCQYGHTTAQLWNRNATHPDFLLQRLGIGQTPFQVTVEIPKERFSMLNDALATKARMIKENYAVLRDVPVCAALNRKLVGVIGGPGRSGCYPVVHDLVAQIAANNCYTDVKLGFVYEKEKQEADGHWAFTRWLPHVWSEDKRVRYVADSRESASDIFYELVKILRMRAEDDPNREAALYKPHYILLVEDASMLEGELITTFLLDKRELGVTTVLLAENYEELPNSCEYIIENTAHFQGVYEVTDPMENRRRLKMDQVAPGLVETFARRLSRVQVSEIETGGELPASLTFLEMYGVKKLAELNVEERWRKNRTYDNIRGLLGQKSGGAPCYLDVHEKYHGPHGLIAGTTGSGKSETLQTYILSLAINYSPDDVGFFVIDYKGGGMANLFSGLPHLIGQISNLSGNQVHRAMISIKSENVRRQKIFNDHGINNINSYTQLYKNGEAATPVPHMFIIIDEFAELKREEPDFMKELISVAQVGRSLGVHLILATQKPSGTVDDNIWSNARFRLCLRVQDKQDSKDMLHRTDAAYITQAGRCYLQVGNDELFELFQSGWSGAVYEEGAAPNEIARMLSVTGKAALVGSHSQLQRKAQEQLDWINTLLGLVDQAAGGAEAVPGCAEDSAGLSALTKRFFALAEETSLEYPENDYNAQRVQELVLLYAEARRQGAGGNMAQAVLELASHGGHKLPEQKKRTQLEAIVEYLAALAKRNGYEHNLQLWMPVLPPELYLHQLRGYTQRCFDGKNWPEASPRWELEAYVGLYDDPVNQTQMPMTVDFANNGSHVICGTVGCGKSTFLVTLLYSLVTRYTPDALQIYGIDFSSRMLSAFDGLVHVGGLMYENDLEKISKFFHMLSAMLTERKTLLKGGSYTQLMQAEGQPDHPSMPAVVVVFDNYAAFRTKTDFIYDDFMMKLSQEGVGCGIFLLIAAAGFSSGEIPNRMGENLRTVVCLEMTDRFAYADALRCMHLDVMPEENIKGRGLSKLGDRFLEFQTALCLEAEDDFSRNREIQRQCRILNSSWTGRRARPIPEIPEKPVWQEFERLEEVADMLARGRRIPIGYDQRNAAVYGIDLQRTYTYLISGKARTGKTNLLRALLAASAGMDAAVVLIDYAGEFAAADGRVRRITTDQELYSYLLELQDEFITRNQFKRECLRNGDTDDEIFEKMQDYRKIFLMIGNLTDFAGHVERPEEGVDSMSAFICNLLDKGANHNVYWFACLNSDDAAESAGLRPFDLFVRGKTGIHFGGNVDAQSILDFDYVKFNDRGKALKPGIGLLSPADEGAPQKVIVPLCRR